jgi:hypothetical protein
VAGASLRGGGDDGGGGGETVAEPGAVRTVQGGGARSRLGFGGMGDFSPSVIEDVGGGGREGGRTGGATARVPP